MAYNPASIESKWQAHWDQNRTFATPNPGEPGLDPDRPKYYVLAMFPYPSGAGMHMGHALNYTSTDIPARYFRQRGFNVLHPIGFDAFGLPAEQYAVETGTHPAVTTQKNIDNITNQFRTLGLSFDWDRALSTTDTDYVRWTQWIFLQLYHSYYDPLDQKAQPIRELVRRLEGEDYYVGFNGELIYSGLTEDLEAVGGIGNPSVHKWHELEQDQRERLIDEYRLAFMAEVEVNWCPGLGTVLANEEVTNEGRSERGNFPVFKRPLKQWMLRITAYAERLIDDLDLVDWPDSVKLLQRNWVGKSTGAEVDFAIKPNPERSEGVGADAPKPADGEAQRNGAAAGFDETITVFTTRPDTLFGATYMVLAPEHPLVPEITTDAQRAAVEAYQQQAAEKTDLDRQADSKEKTGVFTGAYATNPVNGEALPIWIADYVMMGYGTGAIMAVPAHDTRDHEFAVAFELPIVEVIQAPDGHDIQAEAWTGDGAAVNSANEEVSLNGLDVAQAKATIIDWLSQRGLGKAKVQYKLRDWLFSRQRYWGEPFPILHGPNGEVVAVDEADLPVALPEMEDFKPTAMDDPEAPPRPPLGRAGDAWIQVEKDGKTYTRELNTMPQWAGSCWYYLRFLDAKNDERFVSNEAEKYWMVSEKRSGGTHAGGVDLYIGGVEHAVLHLLYARFWHKVLFDLGEVSTPEPFGKLFNQGYIQAHYYEDARGVRVPAAEIEHKEGKHFYQGDQVTQQFGKMGKSLKNSVAPDEVIEQYGADTLRLFLMYLGPLEQSKLWNPSDIVGVHRFLNRLWRNLLDEETDALLVADLDPGDELRRKLHQTIKRVTEAMDTLAFNVAIAALIELNNALVSLKQTPREIAEPLVVMLAPLAPHIAEELWQKLGHNTDASGSVANEPWPIYQESLLVADTIELPVQVNGKLRGKVTVPAEADKDTILAAARADENVAGHLEGKTIRKEILVPGKLVNLVVG